MKLFHGGQVKVMLSHFLTLVASFQWNPIVANTFNTSSSLLQKIRFIFASRRSNPGGYLVEN